MQPLTLLFSLKVTITYDYEQNYYDAWGCPDAVVLCGEQSDHHSKYDDSGTIDSEHSCWTRSCCLQREV
ncbi:hypothetical protein D3C80_914970 [compost metagenome]